MKTLTVSAPRKTEHTALEPTGRAAQTRRGGRSRATAERGARRAAPRKKLFYRIQEAAELTGLRPSVLRYWETEFKELRPEKDASDQRRYRAWDLQVIRAIRKLLYEERFTIKGARKRLRDELREMRRAKTPAKVVELSQAVMFEPGPIPEVAPKVKTAPARARHNITEFRTGRSKGDPEKAKLDRTLKSLRSEVNELLDLLS